MVIDFKYGSSEEHLTLPDHVAAPIHTDPLPTVSPEEFSWPTTARFI